MDACTGRHTRTTMQNQAACRAIFGAYVCRLRVRPAATAFSSSVSIIGCSNATELDVSHENPNFLEWNDMQLQVTSTGQIVTAPECIAPGAKISKTVHNFSADMTVQHMATIAEKRKDASTFLASVTKMAPQISGFIAPPAVPSTLGNPANVRFLGAQFVVPRPPGCKPGHYIPGCPNPRNLISPEHQVAPTDSIGLVERYQVPTPPNIQVCKPRNVNSGLVVPSLCVTVS